MLDIIKTIESWRDPDRAVARGSRSARRWEARWLLSVAAGYIQGGAPRGNAANGFYS